MSCLITLVDGDKARHPINPDFLVRIEPISSLRCRVHMSVGPPIVMNFEAEKLQEQITKLQRLRESAHPASIFEAVFGR